MILALDIRANIFVNDVGRATSPYVRNSCTILHTHTHTTDALAFSDPIGIDG